MGHLGVQNRSYEAWVMYDHAKKAKVEGGEDRRPAATVQQDIEKWMKAGYVLEYEGATMINIIDPATKKRVAQYT